MRGPLIALRNGLLLVLAGLILSGCAGRSVTDAGAGARSDVAPLIFRLGSIEVIDESGVAPASLVAGSGFSQPPVQVLRDWAVRRLASTAGAPGQLRFRITEAAAGRTALDGTPGVRGWFTRDQAERVGVVLAGRLEALRNDGSLIASASARAGGHRTFAEKVTPAERRAGLDILLADTLAAFEREIEAQVQVEMGDLLQ